MVLDFSAVKMPESGWNSVLLGDFLENCMDMFSVPCTVPEANTKTFQPKHLNIIDPMKENNNLGRSVHREVRKIIDDSFCTNDIFFESIEQYIFSLFRLNENLKSPIVGSLDQCDLQFY